MAAGLRCGPSLAPGLAIARGWKISRDTKLPLSPIRKLSRPTAQIFRTPSCSIGLRNQTGSGLFGPRRSERSAARLAHQSGDWGFRVQISALRPIKSGTYCIFEGVNLPRNLHWEAVGRIDRAKEIERDRCCSNGTIEWMKSSGPVRALSCFGASPRERMRRVPGKRLSPVHQPQRDTGAAKATSAPMAGAAAAPTVKLFDGARVLHHA